MNPIYLWLQTMFLIHQICLASGCDSPPGREWLDYLSSFQKRDCYFYPCAVNLRVVFRCTFISSKFKFWVNSLQWMSDIHKSGHCPASLLPFLEQFGQIGLCNGTTRCPVSYQRCSLREGARIPATQRKKPHVEQFTKFRLNIPGHWEASGFMQ